MGHRAVPPFATLDNLREVPYAVASHTDDVRVFAGCVTGRKDWPTRPAARVPGASACRRGLALGAGGRPRDRGRRSGRAFVQARARGEQPPVGAASTAPRRRCSNAPCWSRALKCCRLKRSTPSSSISRSPSPRPRDFAREEAWGWLMEKIAAFRAEREGLGGLREQRDGDGGRAARRPFLAIGRGIGHCGKAQRRPPERLRERFDLRRADAGGDDRRVARQGRARQASSMAARTSAICRSAISRRRCANLRRLRLRRRGRSSGRSGQRFPPPTCRGRRVWHADRRRRATRRGCGEHRPCWRSRRRRAAAGGP